MNLQNIDHALASSLKDIVVAIKRSHTYGEIVTVKLGYGVTIDTALKLVAACSEQHESCVIDRNVDGACRQDVWGDSNGEYRLLLVESF